MIKKGVKPLSEKQIKKLSRFFIHYKNDNCLTIQQIANKLGIDRTTVGKRFRTMFGEEYIKILQAKAKSLRKKLISKHRLKISLALKGKAKPPRTLQHRLNLSKAMSKTYIERFGEKKAKAIKEKIGNSHRGKKRAFKNKELWKRNLSNSLKGREVWNKGKKGLLEAWNKKDLPSEKIVDMYLNQNLSSSKIALKFNVSKYPVLRILKERNVRLKTNSDFTKGKTYEEIYGEDIAKKMKKNLSKALKGRSGKTWAHKIKAGLNRYYENCRLNNIKIIRQRKPFTPEQRLKRSIAQRKYLKEHPEELERLKKMQYPGGISKVEQRMLNFLKKNFKENEDFYFDKQDCTGKTFYRPDFQFLKKGIIIEVDGYYTHFTEEGYKKDRIREHHLEKAGWKIYRFNFYDIDRNYKFEKVKIKIMSILGD
ncbi:MAG: DUF559 domain-containing protein [Nanoarchaeota archaeon]|nr:DUF559 domain-containing protein [Nanoarchaeota archaeon]